MKVCITEKPSVARDIARILGASRRHDGFFEGDGVCVTWTFGHLCCLKEPHDYTDRWKYWSLTTLPMVPPRFGIKVINDKGIKKQFDVIKSLVVRADEVVNCGDAGQEGELIQRWVMQKAGVKCPVKRLWISSLTDQAIRQGFSELRPESDYRNLYEAGLSRAIGDWLLGLNATRLYTLKYGGNGTVLSIGRVQTPTLALIVERHRQIADFKPEDYWELKTLYRDVTFNARTGKFIDHGKVSLLLESLRDKPLTVTDVTKKKGRESAPRLFDLTSLQVESNRLWGWTADETLRHIQSLYEKKVTTYPRVDTTYLPDDIYPKIPDILRRMTPYATLTAPVLGARIPKSKKVFDNAKVTDHHAIIPTGESPSVLVGDERKLYHLIARRFIAAFYPDCLFDTTTVTAKVDSTEFRASGKVITSAGWRAVYEKDESSAASAPDGPNNTDDADNTPPAETVLPHFEVGENGSHKPFTVKKTTQPPKPYTEGTLLRAMESAGKNVDDEELREALKENGIGRPSTRSAIIETLFRRRYLRRERKNIHPTQAGIDLIDTISTDLLKSAKLTGIWENKLRRIEQGSFSASDFIAEIKELLNNVVTTVMNENSNARIQADQKTEKNNKTKTRNPQGAAKTSSKPKQKITDIVCPTCGKGHLIVGKTAVGCDAWKNGCKFLIPFEHLSTAKGTPVTARNVSAAQVLKHLGKQK